jgi:retron-type reverse transcriptase
VNWGLDADIRAYFDSIDHDWLLEFVEHRIADTTAGEASRSEN